MNERKAIESTYFDKFTVFRRDNYKDPESKQTKQKEIVIAENIKCALSRNSGRETNFTTAHGDVQGSYTLFCAPEVDIISGDRIEVTTSMGQALTLWAGKPFKYISHGEIPMSEDERS